MGIRSWGRAIAAAIVLTIGGLVPASAGPAEVELLASYVGTWAGESALVGGEKPEEFRCRLTVSKGRQARINYAGRCSLVSMNLSVSGTILYDDGGRRYQASMSSNVGFRGAAVGRKSGERITFELAEQQVDRGGNDIRIGATIILVDGQITVDFEVEFNNSGNVLTANVPFNRT